MPAHSCSLLAQLDNNSTRKTTTRVLRDAPSNNTPLPPHDNKADTLTTSSPPLSAPVDIASTKVYPPRSVTMSANDIAAAVKPEPSKLPYSTCPPIYRHFISSGAAWDALPTAEQRCDVDSAATAANTAREEEAPPPRSMRGNLCVMSGSRELSTPPRRPLSCGTSAPPPPIASCNCSRRQSPWSAYRRQANRHRRERQPRGRLP